MLKNRIIFLRSLYQLKQNVFAEKVGLTASYVSALEHGKRTELSQISTMLISQVFKCSEEWLIKGEVNKPLCKAIGKLIHLNFDNIESLISITHTSKAYLDAVADCEISPSTEVVRALQDAGLLKGEEATETCVSDSTKDKEITELKKERDWLRKQNEELLQIIKSFNKE
jgi:transcriptional regulator with XRE-family HTH domain